MYITISRGRKPASLFLDEALRCALTIGTQLTRLDPASEVTRAFPLGTSGDDQRPTTFAFDWGTRRCHYVYWHAPALTDSGHGSHLIVTFPNLGPIRYEMDSPGLLPHELTRLEADLNKSRRLAKENSSDRPDH